jgi:proline iminopeptidase/L-proline amide hydrolase
MDMTRRTVIASSAAALATRAAAQALPPAPSIPGIRIAPDREEMIAVPGGHAYVRINGDLAGPRPPIVMLHGGPGSSHWYFLNGTALADERAVILYDQLDCGRSDHPADPANWHVPRFVAELEAIRAALHVERWHALGASWGGTVLLEHAATRPASLASAILQSPLVSTALWLRDANRLRARMPAAIRRTLDSCDLPGASDGPGCEAAMNVFYARHVRRFAPTAEIAAYKAAMPRSFSEDIYRHMWGWAEFSASGTLKDYDGTALLPALEGARTLFVAGEHDEAIPATVEGFARQAGAAFRQVPGAAHSVMNDNPADYVALLRAWMARHD